MYPSSPRKGSHRSHLFTPLAATASHTHLESSEPSSNTRERGSGRKSPAPGYTRHDCCPADTAAASSKLSTTTTPNALTIANPNATEMAEQPLLGSFKLGAPGNAESSTTADGKPASSRYASTNNADFASHGLRKISSYSRGRMRMANAQQSQDNASNMENLFEDIKC